MTSEISHESNRFDLDAIVLEAERLATLRRLDILDTPPEASFDRITQLASRIFDIPICLVSLIDEHRQWFKSCWGLADYGVFARETPLELSFCVYALTGHEVMVVPDTLHDARFADYPIVTGSPGIRFYAGAPLRVRVPHEGDRRGGERRYDAAGADNDRRQTERRNQGTGEADHSLALGTLCLVDTRPRAFGREQRAMLADLAQIVENEIRLRFTATMLQKEIANSETSALNQRTRELRPLLATVLSSSEKLESGAAGAEFNQNFAELREAARQLLELCDSAG